MIRPKTARIVPVYNRKGKLNKDGVASIELRIDTPDKGRVIISTGLSIEPKYWNEQSKRVKSDFTYYKQYNAMIDNLVNTIRTKEASLALEGESLTVKVVKETLDESQKLTFSAYADNIFKHSTNKLETISSQKNSISVFNRFVPEIAMDEVTYDTLEAFTSYLIKGKYSAWTIWKFHKDVKKVFSRAVKAGEISLSKNPYTHYKIKKPSPNTAYLSYEEVEMLEKATLQDPFKLALDIFLFGCYTGLRISDLLPIQKNDLKMQSGRLRLMLNTRKTGSRVFLTLGELFDGKPEKIAKAYLDMESDSKYLWGKKISDGTFRGYLKVIENNVGVQTHLNPHLARHTFGTLYAKQTGDIFKVMGAMGISKFETAKVYIDMSREL